MRLIAQLMDRQETYRGILQQLRSEEDRSFASAVASGEGMDEEVIISVACILFEMEEKAFEGDPDQEGRLPRENDLIWAIEFLDHLDTLGKKVVPK